MLEPLSVLFWLAVFLILFPYCFYPMLMALAPRRQRSLRADYEPRIAIIIAAFNEKQEIARKLDNTLALVYPAAKRRIIVASDHSTDGTDEVIRGYQAEGVELIRLPVRGGKTAAQNAAVGAADADVLVFTDCGTVLEPDALQALIAPLSDPDTACSGGFLEFTREENPELATRKKRLTDFDQWLKKKESAVDSLVGVNGALYAWRQEAVQSIEAHLTSDLVAPLATIALGKRVAFAEDARGYEAIASSEEREFKRKIRTARAGITAAREYAGLFFRIRRPWVALALWGHKGLRWLGIPLWALALLANLALYPHHVMYQATLWLQVLFLAMALLGLTGLLRGVLRFPYYYCFLGTAALVALVQSALVPASEIWNTDRS